VSRIEPVMNANRHEIKGLPLGIAAARRSCTMPRSLASLVATASVAALAAGAQGCVVAGDVEGVLARLEAPPAVVSHDAAWSELRFAAHASTAQSDAFARAEVRVHAQSDVAAEQGQVRVTLAQGNKLGEDTGRTEDTLPVDAGATTTVPRAAFEDCPLQDGGTCDGAFLVVLTGEGLPEGVKVEVPLVIEAQLFYTGEAPAEDTITLELVE
jgi:hypothetical protein